MFDQRVVDEVFALLGRVGEAVVATVGSNCEVVVHDLRSPDRSVVAISGNLTRRHVGSPVPDPDLLPGNVDRFDEDSLLYRTETPFGRSLLSSTVWIRDTTNQIVGAVCINMDFNDLRAARDLLERALPPDSMANEAVLSTFATSAEEFVTVAVSQVLAEIGKERHQLDRSERLVVMDRLSAAGVFSLRRASDLVAAELGISRASVYSYLKDIRSNEVEFDSDAGVRSFSYSGTVSQ